MACHLNWFSRSSSLKNSPFSPKMCDFQPKTAHLRSKFNFSAMQAGYPRSQNWSKALEAAKRSRNERFGNSQSNTHQDWICFCGNFSTRLFTWVTCDMTISECPPTQTPTQNLSNEFFPLWFPGNWPEFGIVRNNFWSSRIWAIQNRISCTGFKNPGIQPI